MSRPTFAAGSEEAQVWAGFMAAVLSSDQTLLQGAAADLHDDAEEIAEASAIVADHALAQWKRRSGR